MNDTTEAMRKKNRAKIKGRNERKRQTETEGEVLKENTENCGKE